MSEREMRRALVLAQVKSGTWTLVEAAERMDLSASLRPRGRPRMQGRPPMIEPGGGETLS